jgi:hypothetical protein
MTIDPDDLVIFKLRKAGGQGSQKKAESPQPHTIVIPEETHAQDKSQAEAQPPVAAPTKRARMIEINNPQSDYTKDREQVIAEMRSRSLPDKGFMSAKEGKEEAHPYVFDETLPAPAEPSAPAAVEYPEKKVLTKKESRDAAVGKVCFWHNWRNAYGVCTKCRRAFCYEDIVEYGNSLYCLEDIGKAESNYNETVYTKYNNLSLFAAFLFILAFGLFLYFANNQLFYILTYAQRMGSPAFIFSIGSSYVYQLFDFIITIAGLFVGIMIIVQLKGLFVFGAVDGLFAIAAFTYSFFITGTPYVAAISVMYFVALLVLTYSRAAYRVEAENLDYLAKVGIVGA